ncbi:MAG: hypothetical protein M1840_009052 [Geoglossum simile]|nr:MAG: hypothetical protein M1840_009052 [Geoglossum simile]
MEILISDEPQLAVVKGVVADRIQKLTLGPPIMGERCCRASYGMVCTEVYDRARHMGLPTWTDPLDRRLYVPNQIDWFVKKGEPVSTDHPIKHPFTRKIDPNGPRETWKSRLVTSDVDLKFLPRTFSLSQSSSQLHCTLESDLTHIPLSTFKKKNRHWYNKGNAYYRASYSMHVVIGSADLRFELWMDGTRHSEGVPIRVQWDPVVKENTQEAMNRDGVRLNALD